MKKRTILYRIAVLLMILCMAAPITCVEAKKTQTKKNELTITTGVKELVAGKSFTMKASYINEEGETLVLPGKQVNWTVSNTKRATITSKGKLKAKTIGSVTVTAEYEGLKATYKVKILGKMIIGIDAGHQQKGNSELEAVGPGASTKKAKVASGTTGIASKVPEYKVTLEIAKQLKKELISRGYEVVMTRTENDVNISNRERALLLNERCDLGIRLHCDGSSNSSVRGASALFTSTKNRYIDAATSRKSAALADALMSAYCKETGIKNRGGYLRDDLTGNNWSTIPTVVLEMGFMSNKEEDLWMQKEANQAKMVTGIADGIDAYYVK